MDEEENSDLVIRLAYQMANELSWDERHNMLDRWRCEHGADIAHRIRNQFWDIRRMDRYGRRKHKLEG